MVAVLTEPRSIVLEHRVDDFRVVKGAPQLVVCLLAHVLGRCRVPSIRIRVDHTLGRLVELAEEPPVPPPERETPVRALEPFEQRHGLDDDKSDDRPRMLKRKSRCHVCTAIMADHRESLVPERPHHSYDILSHRALRVRRDLGRLAVAAKVGTDDPVLGSQARCNHVPGRVGTWVPMQEHHRRPVASVSDAERRPGAAVDLLDREPVEERHGWTMPSQLA